MTKKIESKHMSDHITPIPEVGKIVHYGCGPTRHSSGDGEEPVPWAALIVRVNNNGSLNLRLFNPRVGERGGGAESVPYAETLKRAHWSWPPSVLAELRLKMALGR